MLWGVTFALKSTFAFEIHCKKHLLTPKTAAIKNQDQSKTLFGVAWKHKMLRDVTLLFLPHLTSLDGLGFWFPVFLVTFTWLSSSLLNRIHPAVHNLFSLSHFCF